MRASKRQLQEWTQLAESSIQNDEDHERALLAIRKLFGVTEGSEADQLRDKLFRLVSDYEKQEFPYGEPHFQQWQEAQTEEVALARLEKFEAAEKVVSEEEFNRLRSFAIKRSLKDRRIKQVELARQMGTDKSFINNVLKGRRPPSDHMISYLYYEVGVPIESLIPRPETFVVLKTEKQERLKVIRKE